jgi:ribonucleoside-triphosphate reductase
LGGREVNINIKLAKNFTTQYNKMFESYGEEFAQLNGFGEEQLSFTDFINNFIDAETVADASVDGNANVGSKDMRTLMNEMPKAHRKLLAYNKIYYELNKKYGFKTANEWLNKEWTKALYMHDADTSTFVHYCFAYDLKDLAEKGLYFLNNFNAEPPKHLSTFVDFVKEFISFASNRSSGAVGLPNLIPYMYYFWKKDCENGYATKSDDYYARQQIQRFIYAVNQPYVRDGMQSAFTNVSVFDEPYLEALFGGAEFPDGTFMIDELEGIKEFQKTFMDVVSDIRSHNMFTFPVLTISLLRQNGKFADPDFAEWGVRHNMKWNDSNLFIDDSVTSLSNCCRLKSNIDDLGYFNSIGGTALKVGSVKVSTVNLARLALEHPKDEKGYLVALKDLVELDCKVLDVVRHIIERNVEKGLLPNFSKGLVDFQHLYNTVGFIGIYETMKTFGYIRKDEFGNTFYTADADNFGKKIFEVIHRTKDQFALDKDYKINCEQIPGEQAAAKMQKADTLLYPETVVDDLPLYGNQFIPLGIKTTIQERIRIASLFDSYCNGGSIAHINIEAPFNNFEEAWKMTEYIADQGLTYFAFNTKIQACKHNHAFYGKVCPVCGGPVETEYTRIVGFYTPIKTWSKPRKEEYKMREWENVNK